MIVEIEHKCGHTVARDLKDASGQEPGPRSLNKGINFWGGRECANCWRQGKQAESNKASELVNSSFDLPTLKGSEKQVAWAMKLRIETLSKVEAFIEDITVRLTAAFEKNSQSDWMHIVAIKGQEVSWEKSVEENREWLKDQAVLLSRVVDAKFWIDTRGQHEARILGHASNSTGKVILKSRGHSKEVYSKKLGRTIRVGGTKVYENIMTLA